MSGDKEFKDLPEGWKWVRLGEVIEEVNEKVGKKDLEPVAIGVNGVKKRSEIYYKDLAEDYSKNKVFKTNNIAFGLGSNEMAIGVNIFKKDYCVSPAYKVFELKEQNALYFHYFFDFFKKVVGVNFLILSARQGKSVDFEKFVKEYIPLPPLPEQQKIAEILETIDNAIEKTDKIIEKYKRIKQGLMQDLLTKGIDENGNIRNEKTHKFKDSPLGRIPEEWEVVRLGEIFNIKAGGDIDKLSYCDIKDKRFQYPIFSNTLENKGLYGYSDKFTYPENCITITGRGTLGHAIPRFEKFNAIIRVLVLIPKFEMNIVFISEYINNKINFIIESTGVPQLTAPKVAEYYIPLPPLPEQQRIAEILSQIDQTIEKEQQYKEKLQKIKQGLMQDLLTGKVRVNKLVEEEEKWTEIYKQFYKNVKII